MLQVYGALLTTLIEHIAAALAAALAQARSVGRGAGGWCLGIGKAVAPRWTLFFWLIDFPTKDIGLSQVVVEGSEAVPQRSKKVTSSSRRSSPQRQLGGLSIRGGSGYGPNVCPEPVAYYSNTAVYCSTAVPVFSSTRTHVE